MKRILITLLSILVILLFTKSAYANIGAPMIFLTLPRLLFGLIPIIAIEALIVHKKLKISGGQAVKVSGVTNLISTLVGVPVTWLILVVIQMVTGGGRAHGLSSPLQKFLAVTWQAPWLIPYQSEFYWMLPIATAVLMVPFFFASWLIEYIITKIILKEIPKKSINETVFVANLVTYALSELLILIWLFLSVLKH